MSISYSGLTNYGKSTLPSVESWGTNLNILRDPPKSVYTRKIDKVGETSSITQMIEDSGNRACEAIQVYARGVNPSVSVSYNNNGNNGGQNSGGLVTGCISQAKLPYRIMRDGAFRPPMFRQENLLPLSRMPRAWTSVQTLPGFADYSKKARSCGTAKETKEVKNEKLKGCVRPTKVYQFETPIAEPFEIKYVIQPSLKKSANTGIRTTDRTQMVNKVPLKELNNNNIHAMARTNLRDNRNYEFRNNMNSERYIQEVSHKSAQTNIKSSKNHTNIDEVLDLSYLPVNEKISNISYDVMKTGYEKNNYIHDDLNLERNMPSYEAHTNLGKNIGVQRRHTNDIILERNIPTGNYSSNPVKRADTNVGSREYRLNPKINAGGYSIPSSIPSMNRIQEEYNIDSEKSKMSRMVYEQMSGRYGNGYSETIGLVKFDFLGLRTLTIIISYIFRRI